MSLKEQLDKQISLKEANWVLFLTGWFRIRMIAFSRPRITELTTDRIVIRIPLNRRTRNHVGSMYFGALNIGADLAAGFMAYYFARKTGLTILPVFSRLEASYLKRADGDVYFRCSSGDEILEMLEHCISSPDRITRDLKVTAYLNDPEESVVAEFTLGLSIKSMKRS